MKENEIKLDWNLTIEEIDGKPVLCINGKPIEDSNGNPNLDARRELNETVKKVVKVIK